jgi:hypothetical protein
MEPACGSRCPTDMLRWLAMLALCAVLAASATWASSREMPDEGLPQPMLADAPEDIAELPCGPLKLDRLNVARHELDVTILRLLEREQTDQVRRVVAYRREQWKLVRDAISRTERELSSYRCAWR